jgi:hypothetical protein
MYRWQSDPAAITELLISRATEVWSEEDRRRRSLGGDLSGAEADMDRYGQQLRYFRRHDNLYMPCMRFPEQVPWPIDLSWVGDWDDPDVWFANRTDGSLQELLKIGNQSQADVSFFLPADVLDFLTTRLTQFAQDFTNGNGRIGEGSPQALAIRVHTKRNGLRVHYAPAYLMRLDTVFGYPTTPVRGPMTPGRWKFGAMGNDDQYPTWDMADFEIPPIVDVHLMVP